MVTIKSNLEIQLMFEGGKRLRKILKELLQRAKPDIHTKELDKIAEELIKKEGGFPSFKTVKNYQWSTCMCVNNEVVHGIPDDFLKAGDILCIDIGMLYKGFHTDTAWTILIKDPKVKNLNEENSKEVDFLKFGEKALSEAISLALVGNRIGQISQKIQQTIEGNGYSVVRSLIGHGVGKDLHEDPQIPGFLDTEIENTPKLKEGMTIAIEVIYNEGSSDVVYKNRDGWTIVTKDGSNSAVFEHTIAILKKGPKILT